MPTCLRSLWLSWMATLILAPSASAVTIDWTFVGDPGNAADSSGFGSVAYAYQISTYEITNSQYAEFLNAVAGADPYELYDAGMGSGFGGLTRDGAPGSYSYSAIAGREDMPVNYVSWYDVLRFANWLNNGQGGADTETGAYTLEGGTPTPLNFATLARNAGAIIFLTSEDEWYKAAYYDALSVSYFDYPAGSNTPTTCGDPTAVPNRANCNFSVGDLTIVGSYTGSASPYGTFDQGGNVAEWNETNIGGTAHGQRGGYFTTTADSLSAQSRGFVLNQPTGRDNIGFRVASIPEPSTGILLALGMIGLAGWRRPRA